MFCLTLIILFVVFLNAQVCLYFSPLSVISIYHKIGYHVYVPHSKTEVIVFRTPQLKCDLSGLSVNVGESMITQSSNMRDLEVILNQFLNYNNHITAICRSTHFHIKNVGKIWNLLSYDDCSIIIHALISCRLYYGNSIMYNVPRSKTDKLQGLQNQCARILTKLPHRDHITTVLKTYIGSKLKIESYTKC